MKREVRTQEVSVDVPERLLTGLNSLQRARLVQRLNDPPLVKVVKDRAVEEVATRLIDTVDEGLSNYGIRRYRLTYAWTEESSD